MAAGLGIQVNTWNQSDYSAVNWLSPDFVSPFDFSSFDISALPEPVHADNLSVAFPKLVGNGSVESLSGAGAAAHDSSGALAISSPEGQVKALYVDSDGSRLTCNERVQTLFVEARIEPGPPRQLPKSHSHLRFPSKNGKALAEASRRSIDNGTYEKIRQVFEESCLLRGSLFTPYQANDFPSCAYFGAFLNLYFECFHEIFPVIHAPLFDTTNADWLLILAMTTLGSYYFTDPEYAEPMTELLRRVVQVEVRGLQFLNRLH